MTQQKTATITERRASYPLQQRLKIYNPDTMARRLNQEKTQGKLVVNGVNILNKSCLDKDIILDRMKQRRETHNRVERRRRDMLNGLINQLAQAMPQTVFSEPEKCHRAEILRQAISYIQSIQQENEAMRAQLGHSLPTTVTMEPATTTIPSSSSSSASSSASSSPTSSFLPPQQQQPPLQQIYHLSQLPVHQQSEQQALPLLLPQHHHQHQQHISSSLPPVLNYNNNNNNNNSSDSSRNETSCSIIL
ncbi:hypothetical protein BDA99DRAFT_520303 [Phascolomyces articulosus]|uniref:BHLH domain-containing protein n=1 Tax=Phascolomyces articulosus TaxID=60185 RepID=A0AAD5PAP5_9FUNG|nr:hypothetical protein BDA99DRAFT_520303 [Phascolomyces articulosus]